MPRAQTKLAPNRNVSRMAARSYLHVLLRHCGIGDASVITQPESSAEVLSQNEACP